MTKFFKNNPLNQPKWRGRLLLVAFLTAFIAIWHINTLPQKITAPTDPVALEYAILMGDLPENTAAGATVGARPSDTPTPRAVGQALADVLVNPFYDNGANDKGLGLQLLYSLARVLSGFLLAALVAIPLGFVIGLNATLRTAFEPIIALLKPISPLAWMPLALFFIKDATLSSVFVIFICALFPMLTNTAFGVGQVRREWRQVAATLELSAQQTAMRIILPAAAPTIVTGARISMGVAWLVIVAAEMLVGGTGIGYFVWNAWNNLSLVNVLIAILFIGLIGMILDKLFVLLQKKVTFVE